MRKSYILSFLLITFLAGCGSYKVLTGTFSNDVSELNETVKTEELSRSMEGKSSLKFVIRMPHYFYQLPREEVAWMNDVTAEIEKDLMRKGHRVKDSYLVEYLLDKGAINSENYASTIDTDVILEIIDLKFDIPNEITEFVIKEKGIKADMNDWENLRHIDCQMAMLECRVILVHEGNIGGIFKIFASGCDQANDFYIHLYENYDGTINTEKEARVGWNYGNTSFTSLVHTYDMNDLTRRMAIKRLVAGLLEQIEN